MCLFLIFTNIPAERIFVGRSHVARVAEARLEQINRYCQVCELNSFTMQYCMYVSSLGIKHATLHIHTQSN